MNALATRKTMTVKEVADVLGVTTEAIKKHVREMYPEIIRNGVETNLTESQVTEIKKRMRPTTEVVGNVTDAEMIEKAKDFVQWSLSKIDELKRQNQTMLPKAECFDRFLSATNAQPVGDVAKMLGYGRNKFFAMLRKDKIFDDNNVPYSSHAKYFEVVDKPITISGEVKNIPVTLVRPEGIAYLSKRYLTKDVIISIK